MINHIALYSFIGSGVGLGTLVAWKFERILDEIIEIRKRYKAGYYHKISKWVKCPACGSRHGSIIYNFEIQKVVHGCRNCSAAWPEKPRVPPFAWDFLGRDLKNNQEQKEEILDTFKRANTPVLRKEEKKAETVN